MINELNTDSQSYPSEIQVSLFGYKKKFLYPIFMESLLKHRLVD